MKLVTNLIDHLEDAQNPLVAKPMAAYMKNKFCFLGIKKPQRAPIQKNLFKRYPLANEEELIIALKLLWGKPEREFHYVACNLAYYYKKLWTEAMLEVFTSLICSKSWWDTVDILASKMVGTLLKEYPELNKHMNSWIENENLWLRRTALIYQLSYKEATNKERLFTYCTKTMHENEFFIRKAIGWSLRQYARTNPEAVISFITKHKKKLSPLSYREASKHCLNLS